MRVHAEHVRHQRCPLRSLIARRWSPENAARILPGQVAELGGEFIDTGHKAMLGWVNKLNLTREDVTRTGGGEITYFFDGQHVPESAVVDEYRAFVAAMRDDLQACSG